MAPKTRSRRGLAAATLVPGAAAAAAVLLLTGDRPEPVQAGLGAPALARLADLPPLEVPRRPKALQPVVPVRGKLGIRVGDFEPLAGGIRPAPPGRIRIPDAGVNAAIEPVRARGRRIEVPSAGWAGWYAGGARPGEPGRAVIIGHYDMKEGPGVFYRVPDLDRGDPIEVIDHRGGVHRYRVVGVTRVRKSRFPTGSVYGHSRNPVLVLVTCGGPYREGRGYRDNVLVYARAA